MYYHQLERIKWKLTKNNNEEIIGFFVNFKVNSGIVPCSENRQIAFCSKFNINDFNNQNGKFNSIPEYILLLNFNDIKKLESISLNGI